ncbi:RNA polymerase sigma factor [Paenibacillus wulumuqiensis]|uniref:RNA polymerase sigma factor n=1 Tax=Paenibacillus wulumuqiensis TaxID=1567107 RepID=UPI0006192633|nr:sigma-70 family RNA polymerase sigma factor [Paenibacillus wulumuqiensis]
MNESISREQAQQLFEEHFDYIFRIALVMTRSRVLADDMTQEVFIRLFRKYHLYQTDKPIRPWLARIAVNLIRGYYRKRKWQVLLGRLPEQDAEHPADHAVLQKESSRMLWTAVSQLSLKQREVIVLHYYAGLSLVEAAEVLHIAPGTCKSRLHAGLCKLRKCHKLREFIMDEEEPDKNQSGSIERVIKEGRS